jgi:hypothetical protein
MKYPRFALDHNNLELLAQLQKTFDIEFEEKNIDYCEVFSKNNCSIIYYNPARIDNDSIAHELLHIWLSTFQYASGNTLYLLSLNDENLSKIFNKNLCAYIGNCMDHIKMYPRYISLGYNPEKFVTLGTREKSNINDLTNLDLKVSATIYRSNAIELYIGNLTSIYADHYPNNYSKHLKLLEDMEPDLFKKTMTFWTNWKEFDIEKIDPIFYSDRAIINNYLMEMEAWLSNKHVI